MAKDPTMPEVLEWARKLLNEEQPLQLNAADKLNIYASYVQIKSSKAIEGLTILLLTLTLLAAFFTAAFYFSQIPAVGFTFAPIIAFVITAILGWLARREIRRRKQ